MAVNPSAWGPKPQFVGTDGLPMVGAKLFAYVGGSVNTKQNTFTSSTGLSANPNPIILNALGEPPNEWWWTSGLLYKIVLAPSTDTDPPSSPIWTIDNLRGQNDVTNSADQWQASGITPTFVSGTSFTLPGDQTSNFTVGRRLKFTVTAGTVYGTILTSVFGALTTVTMTMDAGQVLDSGLSAVQYGLLTPNNISIPNFIVAGTGITITYASGKPTISTTGVGTVPRLLTNAGLMISLSGSAATLALKQADGTTDATASSTIGIGFRNATLTSGGANLRNVSAALSTVISSGSTGGTVSTVPSRIWIAAIDATALGGAVELAWFNPVGVSNAVPFDEGAVITTTAEGGAGTADSAQTWYSTTARAGVPFTILGYFDSTQVTAGTWATAITDVVVNPVHAVGGGITLGTSVASTAGTSIDFLNIPAGVKRITFMARNLSSTGTSQYMIQLGTAGAPETSGYLCGNSNASASGVGNSTTGFTFSSSVAAASVLHGQMIISLQNSTTNAWVESGMFGFSNAADVGMSGGGKALAGVLNMIRLTTVGGADTFDGGEINIQWE